MKATKTPAGNWRVRVYLGEIDGKKKWRSVTASTKQEALRKAAAIVPCGQDMSVGEAARQYMDLKAPVISPSTLTGYEKIYRSYLEPALISILKLDRVTSVAAQKWVSELSKTHSPKTVRNCYGFLTAVLSMYAPDLHLRVKLPQRVPHDLYTPTTDDINAVLAVADPDLRIAILLGATGMMRRGEICALTADDVDRENNTVTVRHSVVVDRDRNLVQKAPKTDSSFRVVELNEEVIAMLPQEGKLVNLNPDQITMRFNRAVKKANLHPFRFHDLRHYAASIAVSSAIGAGSLTVQGRGGWNSDAVMKRVYTHALTDQAQKDTGKILDFYSRNIKFKG